jgi:hypothetical protein
MTAICLKTYDQIVLPFSPLNDNQDVRYWYSDKGIERIIAEFSHCKVTSSRRHCFEGGQRSVVLKVIINYDF